MRFAFWINKATNSHSEHAMRIAFTRQQWLRERASMLRYMYIQNTVGFLLFHLRDPKIFYFIFQNSNVLIIGRFQWRISTEG